MAFFHFHLQVFGTVKQKGFVSVEPEDDVFLDFVFYLLGYAFGVDGEEKSYVNGGFEIVVRHASKVLDFNSKVGWAVVSDFFFVFADENMVGEIAAVVLWIGNIKLRSFEHIRHFFF